MKFVEPLCDLNGNLEDCPLLRFTLLNPIDVDALDTVFTCFRLLMGEALPSPSEDRFLVELEFVQSLANPNYLHCKPVIRISRHTKLTLTFCSDLAQRKYFEDVRFMNFLSYLQVSDTPSTYTLRST